MNRRVQEFVLSKCDRCGKTTRRGRNGQNLYVLPHEWAAPLADQGCFCEPCIENHTEADWLQWFAQHRPEQATTP